MPTPTLSPRDQHKADILKQLRRHDEKDIHQLAAELGVARQALAGALHELVSEGTATMHQKTGHRPSTYTKPART